MHIKKIKKYFLPISLALFGAALALPEAQAVCPACTFIVGAGIGFSRWLRIDDIITGLWIGGLAVSLSGWTISWFNKINFRFYGRKILIVSFYYAMIFLPLYYLQLIGDPLNKFCGIDKIVFGTIVGSFAFLFANIWYEYEKKKNLERAYFPLQKVVMPTGALLILSLVFFYLTK